MHLTQSVGPVSSHCNWYRNLCVASIGCSLKKLLLRGRRPCTIPDMNDYVAIFIGVLATFAFNLFDHNVNLVLRGNWCIESEKCLPMCIATLAPAGRP